jgi:hypothetical protein
LALSFALGVLVKVISEPSTQHLLNPNVDRVILVAFLFLTLVSLSIRCDPVGPVACFTRVC